MFKQIAGVLARRIVFNRKIGDHMQRGERVGLIKFGSCMGVIPESAGELQLKIGDCVIGGARVLANFRPIEHTDLLAAGAQSELQGGVQ